MIPERYYPVLGALLCMGLSAVGLMAAWSFTAGLLNGARNLDPVVVVNRLGFVGWGAGISLIGVAGGVLLADILRWEQMRKPAHVLMFGGAFLMFALPIPATVLAERYLEEAGYVSCGPPSGFKLSRLIYAIDPSDCPKD